MKSLKYFNLVLTAAIVLGLASCDKTKLYDTTIPPAEVHFTNTTQISYAVRGSGPIDPLTIQVGTTDVTNTDRVVTYSITSPTGAAVGTQYSLPENGSITIPAGESVASFQIQGILSGYPTGRLDTLFITLAEPSVKPAGFMDKLTVLMGDICSEANPFDVNMFLGDYDNTNEMLGTDTYGPYTTSISNITPVTASTANVVVQNIFDAGWDGVTFTLDWTDPNNKLCTVVAMNAVPGSDAGYLNSNYAGQTIAVRPPAGYPGTFSSCEGTLTLKMQLGVTNVGWFGIPAALYTVNMAR